MRDDKYIERGYRPQLGSLSSCLESLFYEHTESIDTWSHLLSGLYALLLSTQVMLSPSQDELGRAVGNKAVRLLYSWETSVCLIISVMF